MTRKEYNGWTNYETWNVALWLDNEQGSSDYWNERAETLVRETVDFDEPEAERDYSDATSKLADELESQLNEDAPDLGASCFADLLSAALSEVNWYEIAEHYIDSAKEAVSEV